ncbi:flavonol sulfotransferase-like [Prunus yedoensis var. nudiflora]|uniref:Sulfotransferase n=1 Tax=Prunus yedoensis var. nudiflora TaxID=2094558 RepID=A0A314XPZ2_PRUYE|nr:flavonol sulfotransferase-like [Prunus yedoensis var. nudiflora]
MASLSLSAYQGQEEKKDVLQNCEEIISTLSKDRGWGTDHYYQYESFWYPQIFLEGVIWAQANFRARDNDIFLATFPKCGTTWVKALMFAIQNRENYDFSSHPLLTKSPHDCVPYIELLAHQDNPIDYLDAMASPRFLATHIPHRSLPKSILNSASSSSIEEGFELFCKGIALSGPFWDNVLGYWEASLENPEKVLFLKFEDIKIDTECSVKRLAEFMGLPFSSKEEQEGAVREIIKLCSFDNLSNLEVNKSGTFGVGSKTDGKFSNDVFFRRGQTGDSKNHLTPEMLDRLDKITKQKLGASGLKF